MSHPRRTIALGPPYDDGTVPEPPKVRKPKAVPFMAELDRPESHDLHAALRDALIATINGEGWGRVYVSGILLNDQDLMLAVAQRVRKTLWEHGVLLRRERPDPDDAIKADLIRSIRARLPLLAIDYPDLAVEIEHAMSLVEPRVDQPEPR